MPAAVAFPSWTPHPDVWLLVGLFAAGYAIAIVRLGPRWAPAGLAVVTRFQITCWSLGVFAMWLASDYPIHDIADRWIGRFEHGRLRLLADLKTLLEGNDNG